MRTIPEVAEDIKSILNNIERTEECTGETLVDINELVDEILTISCCSNTTEIRNKAIDEFSERMCDRSCQESFRAIINSVPDDILTQDAVADLVWEVAEQMKAGGNSENTEN